MLALAEHVWSAFICTYIRLLILQKNMEKFSFYHCLVCPSLLGNFLKHFYFIFLQWWHSRHLSLFDNKKMELLIYVYGADATFHINFSNDDNLKTHLLMLFGRQKSFFKGTDKVPAICQKFYVWKKCGILRILKALSIFY